ncbi:MAG: hypothetical protein ABW145_11690, partial [Candidatus Thiodiazotropha sp.]
HLESPNLTPRALFGAFSDTTEPIGLVLTGPSKAEGLFVSQSMLSQEQKCNCFIITSAKICGD